MHVRPNGAVTKEFVEVMVKLAEAYGHTVNETRIRIYARALNDVPIETVRAACSRVVCECRFFPTIAELLNVIRPTREDAALVAWTAFGQAASAVGAWGSVEVEDGAAALALEQVFGSWAAFCEVEEGPAMTQRRQEFLAAYRVASMSPTPRRRLVGLLPPAQPDVASHTWIARIAAGRVMVERDVRQQLEGRPERAALPETGTAE